SEITSLNIKLIAEKEASLIKETANASRMNLKNKTDTSIQKIEKISEDTSDKLNKDARNYSKDTASSTNVLINNLKNARIVANLRFQNKKQLKIIAIVSVALIGSIAAYSNSITSTESFAGVIDDGFRTQYLVQNLRGDTIDTWASWRIPADAPFHIHVLNSEFVTSDRVDAILSVIMSDKEIEIDDSMMHKGPAGTSSVYYDGWHGALNSMILDTKFNIPKNIQFSVDKGESTGNIVITLTDMSSPEGYSGYTSSIVDEANHQILKSNITIYDINKLSTENLKTILRHELGHGFGLAHSTATEGLMYPVITSEYPYISGCNLDAISHLYDGGDSSQVVCEK
ncbi:MAG: matrixin family metalloprotease, partial [Nitrosopumilus sp.]